MVITNSELDGLVKQRQDLILLLDKTSSESGDWKQYFVELRELDERINALNSSLAPVGVEVPSASDLEKSVTRGDLWKRYRRECAEYKLLMAEVLESRARKKALREALGIVKNGGSR